MAYIRTALGQVEESSSALRKAGFGVLSAIILAAAVWGIYKLDIAPKKIQQSPYKIKRRTRKIKPLPLP